MKDRISENYQQESGPPEWKWQENILLIPKDIEARTKEVFGKAAQGSGPEAKYAADLIAKAGDRYFSRMGWFTRTHPQQLPSGRILVPMYSDGYSFGIMAISDDDGATWTASQPLVGNGCIQPSVVRKQDGTLIAYMRDNGPPPKRVLFSTSKDEGVTWSTAEDSEIFNPGTSLEAIRLRNGNWVMVHNDVEKGRYSLAIALSEDEGKTWRWKRHLEGDPAKNVPNQYHYPSVIQSADGFIHVTYSYFTPEGKAIKHARLNEDWIRQSLVQFK
jgi:hypothetical protein